jgi:hypothetical protein
MAPGKRIGVRIARKGIESSERSGHRRLPPCFGISKPEEVAAGLDATAAQRALPQPRVAPAEPSDTDLARDN